MFTRRELLKLTAAAGIGSVLPWRWQVSATQAQIPLRLDPQTQPKFVYPVPNALAPSFIYGAKRKRDRRYNVGMFQIRQNLGRSIL